MKKVKLMLVSLLTVIISLFCLVGCGVAGKYNVASYKSSSVTIEIQNNESYVELKNDNTAVLSVDVASIFKLEGEGTWAKEDNKVVITVDGVEYNATLDGNTLTLSFGRIGSVVFQK